MKTKLYLLWLLCHTIVFNACTQEPYTQSQRRVLGYHISGDEIIFVFDVRDYQKVRGTEGGVRDFKDLAIQQVAVAGEFNGWSRDGWKMTRIDDYRYELRKPIKALQGKMEWQYKFVVNGHYWAEPPVPTRNRSRQDNNLLLHTLVPSIEGNTEFRLHGFQDAFQVVLAGSFNDWHPHEILLVRQGDDWVCKIDLPAEGKFEYKFIVDGQWLTDPANPYMENDGSGNINSVLWRGGKTQRFTLHGYPNADKVVLSGTFNNWNEDLLRFRREGDVWVCEVPLLRGKYQYKFILDGKWITDPDNPKTTIGEGGHTNSVWVVE